MAAWTRRSPSPTWRTRSSACAWTSGWTSCSTGRGSASGSCRRAGTGWSAWGDATSRWPSAAGRGRGAGIPRRPRPGRRGGGRRPGRGRRSPSPRGGPGGGSSTLSRGAAGVVPTAGAGSAIPFTREAHEGVLVYLKPAMRAGLRADIMAYRAANPAFPHETTADQFFDEGQFEAYRELGYQTGQEFLARSREEAPGSRLDGLLEGAW